MKLYIKNMVCVRCEAVVKSELKKMGLAFQSIKSGEVEIMDDIPADIKERLNIALEKSGLGLLDDKKSVLVEKIKTVIIELVHYTDERLKVNLSDYLKEKLEYDYAYLSRLFAEVNGTTIEHYFISLRIERSKELLVYSDLSLIEIAEQLHFSDTSHFCNQFKKATGLTPSYFRQIMSNKVTT
jgi:AraC-like DNA-binding protein